MSIRNADVKFVNRLVNNIGVGINVAQLGRVTKIEGHKANVQPMMLSYSKAKRPMLLDVPIGMTCRPYIKVGSVVVVLFMDRDMSNWDGTSKDIVLDSKRMHNISDAVIIEALTGKEAKES